MNPELFLQFLINGIALGSLYALIAIGYTIIYGVVQLINFAHGEFFMVAAFMTMWGVSQYGMQLGLAFPLATLLVVGLALFVDRTVYRPLREQKTSSFIGAISGSFLLQNLFVVLFTSRAKPFPHPQEQP